MSGTDRGGSSGCLNPHYYMHATSQETSLARPRPIFLKLRKVKAIIKELNQ